MKVSAKHRAQEEHSYGCSLAQGFACVDIVLSLLGLELQVLVQVVGNFPMNAS